MDIERLGGGLSPEFMDAAPDLSPADGFAVVTPQMLRDSSLASVTPIPIPGPDVASVTPIPMPGPDPASVTPIPIPGPDLASVTPIPIPVPSRILEARPSADFLKLQLHDLARRLEDAPDGSAAPRETHLEDVRKPGGDPVPNGPGEARGARSDSEDESEEWVQA